MTETINKVLVVDDDLVFRVMLESCLESYQVETASTADEALEKLASFRPDIILLDVELAEGTGFDLCRTIRSLPEHRFTKLAFISSHTSVEKRLEGYDAGGDDFITKPLNAEEVNAKLRVLMRLKAVEEVDQLKRGFLNLISHETMTPLTVIGGYCELMLGEPELDLASRTESLQAMSAAVKRLSELIRKTMLSCSLHDTTQLELHSLPVRTIVNEATEAVRGSQNELSVGIEAQLEPAFVLANPIQIVKAISFVLDNALRFSAANTAVQIIGGPIGEHYQIEIRDHGPGIPEQFLSVIFEPFSVQDILHHKRGSGLSLHLAHRILQLHDGSITLENAPDGGVSAKIILRQAPVEQGPGE